MFGEETALRQLVKEGHRLQVLVVGCHRPSTGRLEVNQDDVALLGLWCLRETGICSRIAGGRVDTRFTYLSSCILHPRRLGGCLLHPHLLGDRLPYSWRDHANERVPGPSGGAGQQ